jgi:hypothetical protein
LNLDLLYALCVHALTQERKSVQHTGHREAQRKLGSNKDCLIAIAAREAPQAAEWGSSDSADGEQAVAWTDNSNGPPLHGWFALA